MKRYALLAALLIGAWIAVSLIALATCDGLYAAWNSTDGNPWYTGFLTDHLTIWRLVFLGGAFVVFGAPGLVCFARLRKPPRGKLWKRNSVWEWRE